VIVGEIANGMKRRAPDPRSPKAVWDEQHQLLAAMPFAWVLKADELFTAFELVVAKEAESLNQPPQLSSVAYMLAGFAVEVLMKGVLVQEGSAVDLKGRFTLDSHDLLKLAERAALTLSDDESRLLERLQEYLTWAGRYPVPLTSEPMRPRALPGGGFAPTTGHWVGEDWPAVRTFVVRLKALLPVRISYDPPAI